METRRAAIRCGLWTGTKRVTALLLFAVQTLLSFALLAHATLQLTLVRSVVSSERRGLSRTGSSATLTSVTVQLPIYNERNVVERLINCVVALDYPPDLLEIQVLDDSDDDTTEIIESIVKANRGRGIDIKHLRRGSRVGYKAGALLYGLSRAKGEVVAILDADFMPQPNFLRQTVGYFDNPSIGAVQTRWGYVDPDRSMLTRVQAVLIDSHFGIEQAGRSAQGCFVNFNGSGGLWRVSAILDCGSWSDDTLTEDLDISYRAQLAGWRFVYLDNVITDTELVLDMRSYRIQQYRWIKGVTQNALRFAPRVLVASLPWRVKLHAFGQLFETCLFLVTSAVPVISAGLVLSNAPEPLLWSAAIAPAFLVGGLLLGAGYIIQAWISREHSRFLIDVWAWIQFFVFTLGMSVHNCVAVIDGLAHGKGEFERTPKQGYGRPHVSYVPRGFDMISLGELMVWLFLAFVITMRFGGGRLLFMLPALLMFLGLTMVLGLSCWHALRRGTGLRRGNAFESTSVRNA